MTRVKICGLRSAADALAAVEHGADMLGFVFYRPVARYVEPALARDILVSCGQRNGWAAVGVFVNEAPAEINRIAALCGLNFAQLAGDETPADSAAVEVPVIKVVRGGEVWSLADLEAAKAGYGVARFMVDARVPGRFGGTGITADWDGLAGLLGADLLAGGLTADNVAHALDLTNAWGVDVSSGVERHGRKDKALIAEFIQQVRQRDSRRSAAAPA